MQIINKKVYMLIIAGLTFFFWLMSFMSFHEILPISFSLSEGSGIVFFSLLTFFMLISQKNPFYLMTILLFFPFSLARTFHHNEKLPLIFFFSIIVVTGGLIIHILRFKITLKLPPFTLGLLGIGCSIILGGIRSFQFSHFIAAFAIVFALALVFFIFYGDYQQESFQNIAFLFCILGVLLALQISSYYFCTGFENLTQKKLHVGWGVGNNIAMLSLMCIPFTYYSGLYSGQLKKMMLYEAILLLQIFSLLFTYSRGCIGILAVFCLFLFIFTIIHFKKKRFFLLVLLLEFLLCLILFALTLVIFHHQIPDFFPSLWRNLVENIRFDSMNSRLEIYQYYLKQWKMKPLFGWGFFYPQSSLYRWGHSTLIHTLYISGIFGAIALCYHLFEKYYSVLKKMNLVRMCIFFSFLLPGIYGMFDLTYYYMYFMFPFLIALFLLSDYLQPLPYYVKWQEKMRKINNKA